MAFWKDAKLLAGEDPEGPVGMSKSEEEGVWRERDPSRKEATRDKKSPPHTREILQSKRQDMGSSRGVEDKGQQDKSTSRKEGY